MAYATDTKPGDGSTVAFTVSFDFIQRSHVQVYRVVKATKAQTKLTVIASGKPTGDEYVWSADDQITVGTAPTTSEQLEIIRETPETFRIIQWNDGSYIVADDLNTSDTQWLYLIQENSDRIDTLEGATGGATGLITEAEATADPTNPAWSGDLNLASAGAIERVYSTIVGDGASYPGSGNLGKDGKIRIKTSGKVPELYYWSAKTKTWVQIATKGDTGSQGPKGDAATVDAGKTTTLAEGSKATVTNSGTVNAAIFDFGIPKGDKGNKGDKGDVGPTLQSDWNETDNKDPQFILNKPTIPAAQIQSDWAQADTSKVDFIVNKPVIPPGQVQSDWKTTDTAKLDFIKNKPPITVNSDDNITNVQVDLSYTAATDKGTVNCDKGANASIPVADATNAGLMAPGDKSKLDGLSGALVYKGDVDLTSSTVPDLKAAQAGYTYTNSTAGTASKEWGDKTKGLSLADSVAVNDMVTWNGTEFIFQKNTGNGVKTDLGYVSDPAKGTVTSSTGNNAEIPAVDGTNAGLMLPGQKTKLEGIAAGAEVNVKSDWNAASGDAEILNKPSLTVDLGYTAATDKGTVTNSSGNDATIPLVVSEGDAGLMTGTDKKKLEGIAAGAQVNVGTDLSHTTNATQVTVKSNTGSNTTLDQADGTNAGVMSAAMYTKLNGLTPGGEPNVQADWNETTTTSDAFIKNKPAIPVVPTVGNGSLTIQTAGEKASASGTFTANQTGNSTLQLPQIRYQDLSGTPSIPGAPGNGQINVNAGNGLSVQGSNATANQSTDTTRTLSVKANGTTINVSSDGISVNTANLGIPAAANNGAIKIEAGDGLSASGSNATANQSTDTTRTLKLDKTFVQDMIDASGGGGGGGSGAAAWGTIGSTGNIIDSVNVADVYWNGANYYQVTFETPMPDDNYAVVISAGSSMESTNITVFSEPYTYNGKTYDKTAKGFGYYVATVNGVGKQGGCYFAVHAVNAAPLKGGTGTDAWGRIAEDGTRKGSFNVADASWTANECTVTFTTPMPTANYAITATAVNQYDRLCFIKSQSATGFVCNGVDTAGTGRPAEFSFQVNATNATLPQTVTQEQIDAAANNPGASAWGEFDSTGAFNSGVNIAGDATKLSGTGKYRVTWATPMPSANYAVSGSVDGGGDTRFLAVTDQTATYVDVACANDGGAIQDSPFSIVVFATNALPPRRGTGVDAWGEFSSIGVMGGSFNANVFNSTTGKYEITFDTAMPTANYAVNATTGLVSCKASVFNKRKGGFDIYVVDTSGSASFNSNCDCNFTVNCTNATLPTSFTEEQIQGVIDAKPEGIARAWINFDGTGSQTIRSSFNIDSIRDNGNGDFDLFFETPMKNANYVMSGTIGETGSLGDCDFFLSSGRQMTYAELRTPQWVKVMSVNTSGDRNDRELIQVVIHGD